MASARSSSSPWTTLSRGSLTNQQVGSKTFLGHVTAQEGGTAAPVVQITATAAGERTSDFGSLSSDYVIAFEQRGGTSSETAQWELLFKTDATGEHLNGQKFDISDASGPVRVWFTATDAGDYSDGGGGFETPASEPTAPSGGRNVRVQVLWASGNKQCAVNLAAALAADVESGAPVVRATAANNYVATNAVSSHASITVNVVTSGSATTAETTDITIAEDVDVSALHEETITLYGSGNAAVVFRIKTSDVQSGEIDASSIDLPTELADAIQQVINAHADFSAEDQSSASFTSLAGYSVSVIAADAGRLDDWAAGDSDNVTVDVDVHGTDTRHREAGRLFVSAANFPVVLDTETPANDNTDVFHGKYFTLQDSDGSVAVQFSVTGVADAVGSTGADRVLSVELADGDTAGNAAAAIAAAIDGDSKFFATEKHALEITSAALVGDLVTLTHTGNAARAAPNAQNSGLGVYVQQKGAAADAAEVATLDFDGHNNSFRDDANEPKSYFDVTGAAPGSESGFLRFRFYVNGGSGYIPYDSEATMIPFSVSNDPGDTIEDTVANIRTAINSAGAVGDFAAGGTGTEITITANTNGARPDVVGGTMASYEGMSVSTSTQGAIARPEIQVINFTGSNTVEALEGKFFDVASTTGTFRVFFNFSGDETAPSATGVAPLVIDNDVVGDTPADKVVTAINEVTLGLAAFSEGGVVPGTTTTIDRWARAPDAFSRRVFVASTSTVGAGKYQLQATTAEGDALVDDVTITFGTGPTLSLSTSISLHGIADFTSSQVVDGEVVVHTSDTRHQTNITASADSATRQTVSGVDHSAESVEYWVLAQVNADGGEAPYDLTVQEDDNDLDREDVIVPIDVHGDGTAWLLVVPYSEAHHAKRSENAVSVTVTMTDNQGNSAASSGHFDFRFLPELEFTFAQPSSVAYRVAEGDDAGNPLVLMDGNGDTTATGVFTVTRDSSVAPDANFQFALGDGTDFSVTNASSQTMTVSLKAKTGLSAAGSYPLPDITYTEFGKEFTVYSSGGSRNVLVSPAVALSGSAVLLDAVDANGYSFETKPVYQPDGDTVLVSEIDAPNAYTAGATNDKAWLSTVLTLVSTTDVSDYSGAGGASVDYSNLAGGTGENVVLVTNDGGNSILKVFIDLGRAGGAAIGSGSDRYSFLRGSGSGDGRYIMVQDGADVESAVKAFVFHDSSLEDTLPTSISGVDSIVGVDLSGTTAGEALATALNGCTNWKCANPNMLALSDPDGATGGSVTLDVSNTASGRYATEARSDRADADFFSVRLHGNFYAVNGGNPSNTYVTIEGTEGDFAAYMVDRPAPVAADENTTYMIKSGATYAGSPAVETSSSARHVQVVTVTGRVISAGLGVGSNEPLSHSGSTDDWAVDNSTDTPYLEFAGGATPSTTTAKEIPGMTYTEFGHEFAVTAGGSTHAVLFRKQENAATSTVDATTPIPENSAGRTLFSSLTMTYGFGDYVTTAETGGSLITFVDHDSKMRIVHRANVVVEDASSTGITITSKQEGSNSRPNIVEVTCVAGADISGEYIKLWRRGNTGNLARAFGIWFGEAADSEPEALTGDSDVAAGDYVKVVIESGDTAAEVAAALVAVFAEAPLLEDFVAVAPRTASVINKALSSTYALSSPVKMRVSSDVVLRDGEVDDESNAGYTHILSSEVNAWHLTPPRFTLSTNNLEGASYIRQRGDSDAHLRHNPETLAIEKDDAGAWHADVLATVSLVGSARDGTASFSLGTAGSSFNASTGSATSTNISFDSGAGSGDMTLTQSASASVTDGFLYYTEFGVQYKVSLNSLVLVNNTDGDLRDEDPVTVGNDGWSTRLQRFDGFAGSGAIWELNRSGYGGYTASATGAFNVNEVEFEPTTLHANDSQWQMLVKLADEVNAGESFTAYAAPGVFDANSDTDNLEKRTVAGRHVYTYIEAVLELALRASGTSSVGLDSYLPAATGSSGLKIADSGEYMMKLRPTADGGASSATYGRGFRISRNADDTEQLTSFFGFYKGADRTNKVQQGNAVLESSITGDIYMFLTGYYDGTKLFSAQEGMVIIEAATSGERTAISDGDENGDDATGLDMASYNADGTGWRTYYIDFGSATLTGTETGVDGKKFTVYLDGDTQHVITLHSGSGTSDDDNIYLGSTDTPAAISAAVANHLHNREFSNGKVEFRSAYGIGADRDRSASEFEYKVTAFTSTGANPEVSPTFTAAILERPSEIAMEDVLTTGSYANDGASESSYGMYNDGTHTTRAYSVTDDPPVMRVSGANIDSARSIMPGHGLRMASPSANFALGASTKDASAETLVVRADDSRAYNIVRSMNTSAVDTTLSSTGTLQVAHIATSDHAAYPSADGIVTFSSLVLLTAQTDTTENGLYINNAGTLERPALFSSAKLHVGVVFTQSLYARDAYEASGSSPSGFDELTFTRVGRFMDVTDVVTDISTVASAGNNGNFYLQRNVGGSDSDGVYKIVSGAATRDDSGNVAWDDFSVDGLHDLYVRHSGTVYMCGPHKMQDGDDVVYTTTERFVQETRMPLGADTDQFVVVNPDGDKRLFWLDSANATSNDFFDGSGDVYTNVGATATATLTSSEDLSPGASDHLTLQTVRAAIESGFDDVSAWLEGVTNSSTGGLIRLQEEAVASATPYTAPTSIVQREAFNAHVPGASGFKDFTTSFDFTGKKVQGNKVYRYTSFSADYQVKTSSVTDYSGDKIKTGGSGMQEHINMDSDLFNAGFGAHVAFNGGLGTFSIAAPTSTANDGIVLAASASSTNVTGNGVSTTEYADLGTLQADATENGGAYAVTTPSAGTSGFTDFGALVSSLTNSELLQEDGSTQIYDNTSSTWDKTLYVWYPFERLGEDLVHVHVPSGTADDTVLLTRESMWRGGVIPSGTADDTALITEYASHADTSLDTGVKLGGTSSLDLALDGASSGLADDASASVFKVEDAAGNSLSIFDASSTNFVVRHYTTPVLSTEDDAIAYYIEDGKTVETTTLTYSGGHKIYGTTGDVDYLPEAGARIGFRESQDVSITFSGFASSWAGDYVDLDAHRFWLSTGGSAPADGGLTLVAVDVSGVSDSDDTAAAAALATAINGVYAEVDSNGYETNVFNASSALGVVTVTNLSAANISVTEKSGTNLTVAENDGTTSFASLTPAYEDPRTAYGDVTVTTALTADTGGAVPQGGGAVYYYDLTVPSLRVADVSGTIAHFKAVSGSDPTSAGSGVELWGEVAGTSIQITSRASRDSADQARIDTFNFDTALTNYIDTESLSSAVLHINASSIDGRSTETGLNGASDAFSGSNIDFSQILDRSGYASMPDYTAINGTFFLITESDGTVDAVVFRNTSDAVKYNVRVATTANITVAAASEVDGVTLAGGDLVLVKDQDTASENGIYVFGSGALTRASDFAVSGSEFYKMRLHGSIFVVEEGTANGGNSYMTTRGSFPVIGTDAISFVAMSADTEIAPIIDTADAVSSDALIHNNGGTYTATTVGTIDSIIYIDDVNPADQAGTVARKVADAISDSATSIISDVYVNMAGSLTASAIAYSALTEGTSNTTYRKVVDDAVSGTRLLNESNTEYVPDTDSNWTLRLNARRGVSKTNTGHFYANAEIAIAGDSPPGTLSDGNAKYVVQGDQWSTDYDISVTLTQDAADGEIFYIVFYGNSNAPQAELPVVVRAPAQDVDGFYRSVEEGSGSGLIDRAHSFPDSLAMRLLYSDVRMNEDAGLGSGAWNPIGYSYEARLLARVPTAASADAGTWHNITAFLSDSRNWSSEAGAAAYSSEDASLKLTKDGTRVGSDVLLSVTGLPERYRLTASSDLPLDGTAVEVEFDAGASASDLAAAFESAISFPSIAIDATLSIGSTSATLASSNSSLEAGMQVSGAGIANGTTIVSVDGTALVLSAAALTSDTVELTFTNYESASRTNGVVELTFAGLASYPATATFEAAGGRVDVKTVMTKVDVDFDGVDVHKLSGTHFEIAGVAYWFKQSTPSVLDYTRSDSQSWSVSAGSNNLIKYRLMLRALDENGDGYGTWAISEFYNARASSDDGPDDMERDGYRLLRCAYDAERDDSTDLGLDRFVAVGEPLTVRYPDGSGSVDLGVRFLRRGAQSLASLVGEAEEATAVDAGSGDTIWPLSDAAYVRAPNVGAEVFADSGPFAWSDTSAGDAETKAYGLLTISAGSAADFYDSANSISYVLNVPNGSVDVSFTFSGVGAYTASADYTVAFDTTGADDAAKVANSIAALFRKIREVGFEVGFTKSEWVAEFESRRTAPMLMRDEAYLDEFTQTGSQAIFASIAGDAVDATLRRASGAAVPF